MPLQTQNLSIPLARGLNTKVDPKVLPSANLLVAENCDFRVLERATKRNGYTQQALNILGSPSLITSLPTPGQALLTYKSELLLAAGPKLYSLSANVPGWAAKGQCSPCIVGGKNVQRNGYAQTCPDSATVGGVTIYAWNDSQGGVRASVMDDATGAYLQQNVAINGSGTTPKCVAYSGANQALAIVYRVAGTLRTTVYSPQSNTFGAENTVESDIQNTSPSPFDVVAAGNAAVVFYGTSSAVKFFYLLPTGQAAGVGSPYPPAGTLGSVPATALAAVWDAATGFFYVAYDTATPALRGFVLNALFGAQQADKAIDSTATVVRNITGAMDPAAANRAIWFYEFAWTTRADNAVTWSVTFTSGGTVGAPAVLKRSLGLASKAFVQGGVAYVGCAYQTALNPTTFVLDSAGNVVARLLTTIGGGLTATASTLPQVRKYGQQWRVPLLTLDRLVSQSGTAGQPTVAYLTGVWESTLDFANSNGFNNQQLSDSLLMTGGYLQSYDGNSVVEHAFHYPPENVSASAGGSGSLSAGTYGWAAMWEWQDAAGRIHRSQTCAGSTAVTAGQTLVLTIPTLRVTARSFGAATPRSEVWIVVYRTAANGTTYFRDSSIASPLLNNPAADTVSYTIAQADSAVTANEILYNNANVVGLAAAGTLNAGQAVATVLGNDPIPAPSLIAVGKLRAFAWCAEKPDTLYASQKDAPGLALPFSLALAVAIPQDETKSPVTALSVMDGVVYIFRQNSILAMGGDGPDAAGGGNTFTIPQVLASDVGCVNSASVVRTSQGLYFQSAKGIELLDRGQNVTYIGAPVEQHVMGATGAQATGAQATGAQANGAQITAATVVAAHNQVRWLTAAGPALVYDYFANQWMTFTNVLGCSALLFGGAYTVLRTGVLGASNGAVWTENPATTLDNGAYTQMRIRTGWIKPSGLDGYQRSRSASVRGEYLSPHNLNIRVAYDFEPYFHDQLTGVSSSQVAGGDAYGTGTPYGRDAAYGGAWEGTYNWRVLLRRQKCSAVQFEFQDSPPAGGVASDGSLSLTSVSLEIGVKQGLRKGPLTQRIG